jgi:hypothetical protein
MKMFRNYDGNKSTFGDQSVSASVANPDQVDAFSAIRSSDGALTIMVVNKNLYDSANPTATTPVTINLSNFNSAGVAQEWQLAAVKPSDQTNASITHPSDINFSGNSFTLNVPQESIEMFVLKPASQNGALEFSTTGYSVNENAGTATITVTRTGGSTGTVTLHYATSDGTAKAGTDYQAASGTLTFNSGVSSQTFTVTIIDRGDSSKTTKTINLSLTSPTGGATLGSPSSAVLTINENDLTHDERFVQGLYNDFLGRSGALSELDGWVAAIPSMGRSGVANALARSTEGLKRVVNNLYLRLLNRSADAGGSAYWVGALQNGTTEEQLANTLLASQEFASRANALVGGTNANANFVQALYTLLLNRTPATSEVNGWLPAVASLGRQAVAGYFTGSAEFRSDAVRTFYGDPSLTPMPWEPFFVNLLHRNKAPAASEINGWVNTSTDFVSLEVTLAGSLEYYNNH